jgi:hypothetical protein
MTITITDPALLDQLLKAADTVVLAGPDGTRLGTFTVEGVCRLPPGVTSPFSDEELEERRKQRDGRQLADILRDLKERHGQ